ncbi:MAG: LysR family transcriptional regulator [Pseudomonas sp.]|jgi:DNA-binding transcriptional LysR family regulator|uniref:LysR family transcriptional regulator n=1 Tax=Pseudomonas sp. TaxID=306 RepID=UPI002626CAAE|nr:LysR family transcriptional regulator [Pseudomonas sp.]MDB6049612.1 LysR family transcriptional regulator [Pseudomonas sp.]
MRGEHKIEMSDLRSFVTVAERGSFSAAAVDLHLSQPALSRRIAKLESTMGVRLIERTTRRVDLTAVGRDFARKAREVLNAFESSLSGINEGTSHLFGEVTVACVPSAVIHFLPDVLKEYRRIYPRILVRVIDEGASHTLSSVARSEADFGINYIGAQEINIEFEPMFKERFVLACRYDHPLAERTSVTWAEIHEFDYIAVAKASGNRFLLDMALADLPTLPHPVCEARHVRTVVDMVEAGLGIAAVPLLAMPRPNPHSTLRSIALEQPQVSRTLGLIRRRGRVLSHAAEQLYGMIKQWSIHTPLTA